MRGLFKMKRVSKEATSAFVYTLSSLFTKGLGMISVPIFTRLMTTAEIGEVNLYNSWTSLITVVATLALTSGGYMVALKEFENERDQYQSSVLTLTTLVGLLLMGVYLIAPSFWCGLLEMSHSLVMLMLTGFLLLPATSFWIARQRYEYKYKLSACVSIGSAFFATACAVLAVVYLKGIQSEYVVEGRLYAHEAIVYGVALVLWVSTMVKGRTFVSLRYWKFSLSLSLPLIANSFASQILNQSDRVMIQKYVGESAVGIYGTLYAVSMLSTIVWGAINTSFIPYLYKNLDREEGRARIKQISALLLAIYAGICVLLTFFAPEIVRILATQEYYEAIYIMPPIAAGIFFTAVSNMASNVLLYHKKSRYIMLATMFGAVLNIVLNAIFIPRYGYMAAAYTTLIGHILMAEMQMFVSNRIHRRETGKNETVYNGGLLRLIEAATVGVCMLGLLLYEQMVLRYAVAVLIAGLVAYAYRRKKRV